MVIYIHFRRLLAITFSVIRMDSVWHAALSVFFDRALTPVTFYNVRLLLWSFSLSIRRPVWSISSYSVQIINESDLSQQQPFSASADRLLYHEFSIHGMDHVHM
jgi:hypothetical protein